MTANRRTISFAVALAATLAAVAWVGSDDEPAAPAGRERHAASEERPARQESRTRKDMPVLDLAALENRSLGDMKVDLFASKSWYVPPPPPPPPKPTAPPLPFTYLGRMIEGDGTAVFVAFQDRNQALRVGNVVGGVWRVDAIEPTRMTVTYLPLNEKKYLTLGAAP